jgi:co-chaperonin GroES (HSP10)
MQKLMPLGARVMVEDITPLDDISARAEKAVIHAVVFEHNVPKPTTGKVIAVGSDPEVQRLIKVGDTVFFAKHGGIMTQVEGKTYRTLEFHEITSVLKEEEDENTEPETKAVSE